MSQRILLVDDDEAFVAVLTEALTDTGYDVSAVGTAADALAAIPVLTPDLIVLDLRLPDDDGLVLLPSLSALTRAGIIVCSARDEQQDRVVSLRLGADDFVSKPFDLQDLDARIAAVLRRAPLASPAPPEPPDELHVGDVLIQTRRGRITVADRPVHLTPIEYRLLQVLAAHADQIVTRAMLCEQVWGYADVSVLHTVDMHLMRLRNKLHAASATTTLKTIRNRGYRLTSDEGGS